MYSKLISELESLVCSKCEGTSYWCMSCNITTKIREVLERCDVSVEAEEKK